MFTRICLTRRAVISREEYARIMWAELEELVRAHAETSPDHQTVLEILRSCRPQSSADDMATSSSRKRRGTTDSRTDLSRASTPSSETWVDSW